MNAQLAQLAAGLIAATTPWIVVRVAHALASRHARAHGVAVPPVRPMVLLDRATVATGLAVAAIAVWLPAPSAWIAVPSLTAFAVLSVPAHRVLRDLDVATRAARYVDTPTRAATLVARRRSDYLPTAWRAVLFGGTATGLTLFAWRLVLPSTIDRRLFVPAACALAAVAFLWLYETWIHALVTGPAPGDAGHANHRRRRTIRLVFAAEAVLVTGFVALAHGLLDVVWSAGGAWVTLLWSTGALLGVAGCALVLASDLMTRRYLAVR